MYKFVAALVWIIGLTIVFAAILTALPFVGHPADNFNPTGTQVRYVTIRETKTSYPVAEQVLEKTNAWPSIVRSYFDTNNFDGILNLVKKSERTDAKADMLLEIINQETGYLSPNRMVPLSSDVPPAPMPSNEDERKKFEAEMEKQRQEKHKHLLALYDYLIQLPPSQSKLVALGTMAKAFADVNDAGQSALASQQLEFDFLRSEAAPSVWTRIWAKIEPFFDEQIGTTIIALLGGLLVYFRPIFDPIPKIAAFKLWGGGKGSEAARYAFKSGDGKGSD